MPALNFKKEFVELVLSGKKKQTIRANRKRPFVVGDKLYLYYGMRTKQCRKLGESICTGVFDFRIENHRDIYFNSLKMLKKNRDGLAKLDGFNHWTEMFVWFLKQHGMPFSGQIIIWDSIKK